MSRSFWILCIALIVGLLRMPAGAQHHEHGAAAGKVGVVSFETSCNTAAQPLFNRAVALLHSFEFVRAIEGFAAVLKADPSCAMAEWGIAMSRWGNPFSPSQRPPAPLQAGAEAVARAGPSARKTPREQVYIDAVARLFTDVGTRDQRTRILAYREAMTALAAAHPADAEATIFAALSVAASAPPSDKTYADLLKAGSMLEGLVASLPRTSRAHALHHPQLRRAAARQSRVGGGAALREDRAVGAARAPHAVAHLHAGRGVAGIDRHERQVR